MAGLDSMDCRILESLQTDASQSLADIATQVNLSPNACWHRIKRLEQGTLSSGELPSSTQPSWE